MSLSQSVGARRIAAVAAERDRAAEPAASAGAGSPLGSPSRSVLSRLSYSSSPKTSPYARSSNAAIMTPSELALATATEEEAKGTRNTAAARATAAAKAKTNPYTHPFTYSSEQATITSSSGSDSVTPAAFYLGDRDVTLADQYIKDDGCHRLVHELLGRGSGMGVVTLDLRGNDIRRYGAEALGELLRENATVESLNLEWNFLGDSGGSGLEALCDALKTNRTLKTLDLRNNRLNSECGAALARLLIANHTLQHLDLRWNNLSVNGGLALADALIRNHYVHTIALAGNRIPSQTIRAIEEALAKNRQVGLQAAGKMTSGQADKEPQHRIIELEQQVHDLHRELEHLQSRGQRQEQELQAEQKRCDELTGEVASTKDQLSQAKMLSQKNIALVQVDLEKAQQTLHEAQRAHDVDCVHLKQAQLDLIKCQADLRMTTEDRARLLLARETSHALLNGQLEKLHHELSRAQETSHTRERAFAEERDTWMAKEAHARRIADAEKELAVTGAQEKVRALQLELSRVKDDQSVRESELNARLKALSESGGTHATMVLQLREQLLAQGIAHEEALAKAETAACAKEAKQHAQVLGEFEARLKTIEKARDELAAQAKAKEQQYNDLLHQVTLERQAHLAALDMERQRGSGGSKELQTAQQELFTLRARLMEGEHRLALLQATSDASQSALSEQARRHNDQVDSVYAKANVELLGVQRALRQAEEEKARLAQKVKLLESKIANQEAEQQARSANLASALSVLKSSISVVDDNVNSTMRTGGPAATGSERRGGDDRRHHTSSHRDDRDRERDRDREHHRRGDRDRERERERERDHPSSRHRSDRDQRDQRDRSARSGGGGGRESGSGDAHDSSSLTPRQHRGSAPGSPTSRHASRPSSAQQRRTDHLHTASTAHGPTSQRASAGEQVAASARPQMQQLPLAQLTSQNQPIHQQQQQPAARPPAQSVTPVQIQQHVLHDDTASADASLSYEEDVHTSENAEISF